MSKPIPTNPTADVPQNWTVGQIVSPTGTDVGLTAKHGYNYQASKINEALTDIGILNDAFDGLAGNIEFDGTYSSSNKAATVATVTNKINALDVASVGGYGKYISAISETDGKISATASDPASTYSASGTLPVNGKAVAAALGTLDVAAITGSASKTLTSISETDGKIAATYSNIAIGAGQVTSGTLPAARGGTGLSSSPSMLTNLESTSAANVLQTNPRPGVTGILPVANGGTGASSAAAARTALQVVQAAIPENTPIVSGDADGNQPITLFQTMAGKRYGFVVAGSDSALGYIGLYNSTDRNWVWRSPALDSVYTAWPVSKGGTGAATAAGARANLGITPENIGAKPKQTAYANPAAAGNGITYVATISQNADGVISATRSTVQAATESQSGVISTTAQTFSGHKSFAGGIAIQSTESNVKTIDFTYSDKNARQAYLYNSWNNGRPVYIFRNYSTDGTNVLSTYETFYLPLVTQNRTENGSYNILTTKSAVTVDQGGTGATTAAGAWANLGGGAIGKKDSLAAADIPNLAASKITSGTLPIARGGTGLTASPSILVNLGSTSATNVMAASPRPGVTGTLPISHGGTGATTADDAWTALGGGAIGKKASLATSDIPNLAASKITSGTLALARGGTGVDNSTGGTANTVFARPNGSTGAASFRALVAADIPNLSTAKLTSGTLGVARGGTGQTSEAEIRAGKIRGLDGTYITVDSRAASAPASASWYAVWDGNTIKAMEASKVQATAVFG